VQHTPIRTEHLRPRAAERVRVDLDALLAFEDAPEVPVFVRDLSSHGFRCRCAEQLMIGSPVILHIPGVGQFPASIAWQLGAQAGVQFDSPLPLQTVLSVVLAVVKDALEAPPPEPRIGAAND